MPAKDIYHDAVVNALRKDGWTILDEQHALGLGGRIVWVDIRAAQESTNRIILVEVKSFYNILSPIEAIANAIGKYVLYRAILEAKGMQEDLFLAVPRSAYDGIFGEEVGEALIRQVKIKFLVFDAEKEQIAQWIE
jgi:hypothetical protein